MPYPTFLRYLMNQPGSATSALPLINTQVKVKDSASWTKRYTSLYQSWLSECGLNGILNRLRATMAGVGDEQAKRCGLDVMKGLADAIDGCGAAFQNLLRLGAGNDYEFKGSDFIAQVRLVDEEIKPYLDIRDDIDKACGTLYDDVIIGNYTSTEHTTVLVAMRDQDLKYDHGDKHFKKVTSDANYSVSKGYVAALEDKAVRLGFVAGSAVYFRHYEDVGTLASRHGKAKSCCIRVDSAGGESQHSHPFPESLPGGNRDDTHDSILADLIVDAASANNMKELAELATYIADTGRSPVQLSAEQKRKAKLGRLPASPFWNS